MQTQQRFVSWSRARVCFNVPTYILFFQKKSEIRLLNYISLLLCILFWRRERGMKHQLMKSCYCTAHLCVRFVIPFHFFLSQYAYNFLTMAPALQQLSTHSETKRSVSIPHSSSIIICYVSSFYFPFHVRDFAKSAQRFPHSSTSS